MDAVLVWWETNIRVTAKTWQSSTRNETFYLPAKSPNVAVNSQARAGSRYVVTAEKVTFVL